MRHYERYSVPFLFPPNRQPHGRRFLQSTDGQWRQGNLSITCGMYFPTKSTAPRQTFPTVSWRQVTSRPSQYYSWYVFSRQIDSPMADVSYSQLTAGEVNAISVLLLVVCIFPPNRQPRDRRFLQSADGEWRQGHLSITSGMYFPAKSTAPRQTFPTVSWRRVKSRPSQYYSWYVFSRQIDSPATDVSYSQLTAGEVKAISVLLVVCIFPPNRQPRDRRFLQSADGGWSQGHLSITRGMYFPAKSTAPRQTFPTVSWRRVMSRPSQYYSWYVFPRQIHSPATDVSYSQLTAGDVKAISVLLVVILLFLMN